MNEIWKDIPNYEGLYKVSNLGNVKSLPKTWVSGKNAIRKHEGVILKLCINSSGYLIVALYKNKNSKMFGVHQLVAMAFLNHIIDGVKLVVDHINDNKLDNRLENLQVVTSRFNTRKTQGKYTSNYKGVSWSKSGKKWVSNIRINNKLIYLGLFEYELEAHQAYQNKLLTLSN